MQIRSCLTVFTTLATLFGLVPARAQNSAPPPAATSSTHKQVVPLPPAQLLALLPAAPDQWQLKQSQASNFVMDWASSQAIREFSYTPPVAANASPGTPPPPTLGLRFILTDTGYYQGLMGDFENPTSKVEGTDNLVIGGLPARHTSVGKTGERLRILVNNRYILQIDVQNQPANSAQLWLRIVDLPKLAALPVDGEDKLPRPFPIVRIDEVNPRNNSVSKATWATQAEVDAAANRRH